MKLWRALVEIPVLVGDNTEHQKDVVRANVEALLVSEVTNPDVLFEQPRIIDIIQDVDGEV